MTYQKVIFLFVLLKMGRVKSQSSRRNYHQNKNFNSSNSNAIQPGQHGFFITYCSSKESFVRNEIYNLLNRFADQLFGPEFSDEQQQQVEPTDINDLDSALQNETKQLKSSNKKQRRFQILKSGTKHALFVTTNLPITSINQLIESVFNTSIDSKEQHSRYVERLLPISFICKAYEDDLRKLIIKNEFVEQLLLVAEKNETAQDQTIWFDVQAKKSNNTQAKSSHLEEIVINDLISRKADDLNGKIFKRDYKKPKLHILIHVIRSIILISIVRNYDLYKKYNLASINLATNTITTTTEQQKKLTFDDNDEEEEEEEEQDAETTE